MHPTAQSTNSGFRLRYNEGVVKRASFRSIGRRYTGHGISRPATRDKLNIYLRQDLLADIAAGITGATAGAPQAMAFAIVAGISPVYGLYTAIVSTIVASLFGSSTLMTTGPTNALAVVVASTLAPSPSPATWSRGW